jgi:hypothetical protein
MMYHNPSQELRFSTAHAQVLKEVTIGRASSPGTILHDFGVLLAYIAERELQATSGHQLPLRALPQINSRLAHPIEHGFRRPVQKSFPHIHGLYLLARASGLTYIDVTGRKPSVCIDAEVFRSWQSLNPTEQYGTLLETWFLRGRPDIIGERLGSFRTPVSFRRCAYFLVGIPEAGLQVDSDEEVVNWLRYQPESYNLGLLDLFGLIAVQHGAPEPGKGWRIERIARTPFGEALFSLLQTEFFGDINNILKLEEAERIPFGVLQPVLQPYLPEWQNNLSVSEWTFRSGTHIFKVSLGRLWRRIAIPADRTLDALASTILDSVEFDHDHLHRFSYRDTFGALQEINHSYMDEGPWTSEVLVGDVPLRVGQTMTYLFDFGDWWEFDVTLERVDPDKAVDGPMILESHGQPPRQYRVWDDEE